MKYHFIHALVVTRFESSLTSLDWETLSAQDYPLHAFYCKELGALLFHSDNQKNDCTNMISFLKETFKILNIPAEWEQQIIIMSDDENEYDAQDVLKHFNH
jgi:hypothetical protein